MKHLSYFSKSSNRARGFSIIELLIAVGIIGILSGILIAVINPSLQRNRARDALRAANVSKIGQAVEAFYASEGKYPSDQAELQNSGFLKSWPTETDATYRYNYICEPDPSGFCIGCVDVPMVSDSTRYYKYVTDWDPSLTGGSASMSGVVLKYCSSTQTCDTNDIGTCLTLDQPTPTPTPAPTPTPTPTPTATPTPTPTPPADYFNLAQSCSPTPAINLSWSAGPYGANNSYSVRKCLGTLTQCANDSSFTTIATFQGLEYIDTPAQGNNYTYYVRKFDSVTYAYVDTEKKSLFFSCVTPTPTPTPTPAPPPGFSCAVGDTYRALSPCMIYSSPDGRVYNLSTFGGTITSATLHGMDPGTGHVYLYSNSYCQWSGGTSADLWFAIMPTSNTTFVYHTSTSELGSLIQSAMGYGRYLIVQGISPTQLGSDDKLYLCTK